MRATRPIAVVRVREYYYFRKTKASVEDSITVTITTAALLSIINLGDAKSLEEVQGNY